MSLRNCSKRFRRRFWTAPCRTQSSGNNRSARGAIGLSFSTQHRLNWRRQVSCCSWIALNYSRTSTENISRINYGELLVMKVVRLFWCPGRGPKQLSRCGKTRSGILVERRAPALRDHKTCGPRRAGALHCDCHWGIIRSKKYICDSFPRNNVCVTFLKIILFPQYVGGRFSEFPTCLYLPRYFHQMHQKTTHRKKPQPLISSSCSPFERSTLSVLVMLRPLFWFYYHYS